VLRQDSGNAVIGSGLGNGDRVVLSTIDFPTPGMLLDPDEEVAR
jgi:hypothetical protein